MAKSSRGGRRTTASTSANVAQTTSASTTSVPTSSSSGKYVAMTDTMAQQVRDDVDDKYTSDVRDAIKQYISKATDSQGRSFSQNLNYKLDNGQQLNATEKFIDKYIQQGMHPLGNDVVLKRACHSDILSDLGIKDYTKLTEAQLNQKLVGGTYTTKAYNSFAYDDSKNPFISGPNAGGREVIIISNASKDTPVVFGAKSQAEIITNKGVQHTIKRVYFSGKNASPQSGPHSGRSVPQLIIEVDTK